MLAALFRGGYVRWAGPCVLLAHTACGSDRPVAEHGSPPERTRQEQEAMAEADYEAKLAAREQAALAIENAPPEQLDQDQFYQLLAYHCGDCHVAPLYPVQEWAFYSFPFDDLDRLIAVSKVLPGNGEGSTLVLRMRLGQMPPTSSDIPPMPESAIDLVSDFIDRLPPEGAAAP